MKEMRVIELKKGVFERNGLIANGLREKLKQEKTMLLNLMSSPGSGKTTLLVHTINMLKDKLKIAIMEADIDSDVDARTVADKTGVDVIQLHTGGMCHLDAEMTQQGIKNLAAKSPNLIVLENIGNLLCPAEYDVGAHKNAMILSVPEGDDKPLKYPKIFKVVDAVIISKTDTLSVFDFDMEACILRVKKLNPTVEIFPVSAKTGDGMDKWCNWLSKQINNI